VSVSLSKRSTLLRTLIDLLQVILNSSNWWQRGFRTAKAEIVRCLAKAPDLCDCIVEQVICLLAGDERVVAEAYEYHAH
jgi:hypothetical protein